MRGDGEGGEVAYSLGIVNFSRLDSNQVKLLPMPFKIFSSWLQLQHQPGGGAI
jgi:hypothetical protein